ncbi:hypothetical protein UWK_01786 [Desulfocapsa sulfexigens DSM 10523]|uniref:Uncharacterized protein n=1 Tax=Desulfocapsa sulfexigens (strain DSM 10523 / SB164P1) TaxID=1167006 RepID=M1NF93_DESSD|nr:hypothetical protein [Desulfocapsa sulfexigens]AGF78344.1 hypothetical protein UWK_01786 [Desulfocapsa sulfexigens DSM 10523]
MKYLFTILAVVALSSVVTLYYIWPSGSTKSGDTALSVNGHMISQKQVDDQSRKQGYHSGEANDSVNSFVTRQLLLDEAQRLGIDKENDFRKALKDYYEQSLIKVLTDRKLQSITVTVGEEDIDRYLSCSGKMFTFTRTPAENGKILSEQGRQNSVLFDDLSESLRLILANLKPGENVMQFETGTEVSMISLDKVEDADGFEPVPYDRKRVAELLVDYKKAAEIDSWIASLRKKASVVVYGEEAKND